MVINKIKLKSIETASKEYANTIVEGLVKLYDSEKFDNNFIEDEKESISEDFSNGANWVLNFLIKELQNAPKYQHTNDEINNLWNLVHKLKGYVE